MNMFKKELEGILIDCVYEKEDLIKQNITEEESGFNHEFGFESETYLHCEFSDTFDTSEIEFNNEPKNIQGSIEYTIDNFISDINDIVYHDVKFIIEYSFNKENNSLLWMIKE